MKLFDYLSSEGIPNEENICLLQNTHFPGDIHSCVDWLEQPHTSRSMRLWRKLFRSDDSPNVHISLPQNSSFLFFGRLDKSSDDLSALNLVFEQLKRAGDGKKYVILCGKGDYNFDAKIVSSIPKCVSKIFVNNLNYSDNRLSYFPMGRDFRSIHLFEKYKPRQEKKYTLYCNFSVNTHPSRTEIYKIIQQNECAEIDHMGDFLSYNISREKFYEKLSLSKFAVCPRGNAIDTFRLWDCLYLGVIPIVLKEALFHEELRDLPILFLDSLHEFSKLDAKYLDEKYTRILNQDWNYEKLKLSFWKSRVYSS